MDPKQPSLFTRIGAVEAELEALKALLPGLKADHDALREIATNGAGGPSVFWQSAKREWSTAGAARVEDAFDAAVARLLAGR